MSSEGWMRSGPKPIHRLDPPAGDPDAGHEHGHEQAQRHEEQHHAGGATGRSGCGP